MKRKFLWLVLAIIVVALLIQLIPLDLTNPTPTREVAWDTPQTRVLAQRACFDCHSDETVWPWYSRIAPVSFILADHVNEGRSRLNFSEWDKPNGEIDEVAELVRSGEMPLWDYLLMHPAAKLTAAEQEQLIAGLEATFAADPPVEGRSPRRGGD